MTGKFDFFLGVGLCLHATVCMYVREKKNKRNVETNNVHKILTDSQILYEIQSQKMENWSPLLHRFLLLKCVLLHP